MPPPPPLPYSVSTAFSFPHLVASLGTQGTQGASSSAPTLTPDEPLDLSKKPFSTKKCASSGHCASSSSGPGDSGKARQGSFRTPVKSSHITGTFRFQLFNRCYQSRTVAVSSRNIRQQRPRVEHVVKRLLRLQPQQTHVQPGRSASGGGRYSQQEIGHSQSFCRLRHSAINFEKQDLQAGSYRR